MRNWRLILVAYVAILGGSPVAAAAGYAFPASTAALEAGLAKYRAIDALGGWPTVPDGPALRLGSSGPAVARLRERLAATNDLTAPAGNSADFDADLAVAVKTFQARHGLDDDGVVGRNTRAALNMPAGARVQQITANLDRLKALPTTESREKILINVAAFDLAVVADGRPVFESPVIVGRLTRQTPVFSSAITKVVVNPYWHIPRTIAVKDILPKIKKDSFYLASQEIRVYRAGDGANIEIPPQSVDWPSLNANNFPFRLVQDPGPENALGRVKFYLPNGHDVFLHDTPARELFNREQRTFSSGCIRVSKALQLAEFLLRRDGGDRFRAMAAALQQRETRQIDLARPVPLHIVYLTAWADRDGRVQFRNDVYARDPLIAAGKRPEPKNTQDVARAYDLAPMPACTVEPGQLEYRG